MKDIAGSIDFDTSDAGPARNRKVLSLGAASLRSFFLVRDTLRVDLESRIPDVVARRQESLRELLRDMDAIAPSVTLIGRGGAGKTALCNVLSGNVGLLPMDVPPGGLAVTSIHLNATGADPSVRAKFQFFDPEEWDLMPYDGDGPDPELEALLGQTHTFEQATPALMDRYLGPVAPEDDLDDPEVQEWRVSDLVRTAEIWQDLPELGVPLELRDTPGLDDAFPMRDQVAVGTLRAPDICVVILSAQEALHPTDRALLRQIAKDETRRIVVFVNRIDELADPGEEVPEILASIRETLDDHPSLARTEVVFGSAHWAEMALCADQAMLGAKARKALANWARSSDEDLDGDRYDQAWTLSGLPGLMRAVTRCVVEGAGQAQLDKVRTALRKISGAEQLQTGSVKASGNLAPAGAAASGTDTSDDDAAADIEIPGDGVAVAERMSSLDATLLREDLERLVMQAEEDFDTKVGALRDELGPALQKIKEDFVDRAREALVEHLRSKPGDESWTFNASGLRLVLRTEYDRVASDAKSGLDGIYRGLASGFTEIYVRKLGFTAEGFAITPPALPRIPTPKGLDKAIAVDLGDTWWKRWRQRRRGLKSHAEEHAAIIDAEIEEILTDLKDNQLGKLFDEMGKQFDRFQAEQTQAIMGIVFSAAALRATRASAQAAEAGFQTAYATAIRTSAKAAKAAAAERSSKKKKSVADRA